MIPKDMVLLDDLFYVRCDDAKMEKQVLSFLCAPLPLRRFSPCTCSCTAPARWYMACLFRFWPLTEDGQVRDSSEAAANALKKKEAGGKVTLTFYEKGMWGDKVPWEEWVMHFVVRTEPSFGHR